MRILVIEDEPDLLASLAKALREEGYAVDTAADGEDGLYKAESWDYDALVLDVMLPGLDGWAVLQRLRQSKKTPVLMLTARDTPRAPLATALSLSTSARSGDLASGRRSRGTTRVARAATPDTTASSLASALAHGASGRIGSTRAEGVATCRCTTCR